MRLTKTFIAAAIAASLSIVPASALAKSRDRDHDGMPDKWEMRHHLNPRVNDARRDPDHDGLSNRSEFRHGTNPRKADTDGDGIKDGTEVRDDTNPRKDDSDGDGTDDADEISGTVVSFQNGVLTIQRAATGAGTVTGNVVDTTKIECDDVGDSSASASRDGSDDQGTGDAGDDRGADDHGDDNGTDDQGDDNGGSCTAADLKPGARVHEAETRIAPDGSTVFTEIELVPAG